MTDIPYEEARLAAKILNFELSEAEYRGFCDIRDDISEECVMPHGEIFLISRVCDGRDAVLSADDIKTFVSNGDERERTSEI